jgi:S-DNA-T family DNA segregation ATPase FtsK/SpoIIIE
MAAVVNKKANKNKREKSRPEEPVNSIPSKFKQDIVGILLLALAVFIFVANLSPGTGIIGFYIVKTFLRSLMGVGVLVLPFFIGIYGLILLLRHEIKELTVRLLGLLVLFFNYIAVAQFYDANYFTDIANPYFRGAGGVIGYGVNYGLVRTIGLWGAYIVLTAILVIGLLMFFNVTVLTLIAFFRGLLYPQPVAEKLPEEKPKTKGKEEAAVKALKVPPLPPPPVIISSTIAKEERNTKRPRDRI